MEDWMRGVRLDTLVGPVAVGTHVHATHDDWTVTSNVPCDEALLTADVLERALGGDLGTYFFPADAVLCVHANPGCVASARRIMCTDAARTGVTSMNALTVARTETVEVVEEEEEVPDEGEEDDEADENDVCDVGEEDADAWKESVLPEQPR